MNAPCSHSIGARLAKKIALLTMVVIGTMFAIAWLSVRMLLIDRGHEEMAFRGQVIAKVLASKARHGGEEACLTQLQNDAPMRANSRLDIFTASGRPFFADPNEGAHRLSEHVHTIQFDVDTPPEVGGGKLRVRYTMDFAADAAMGTRWAVTLAFLTLLSGGVAAAGVYWNARRQLRPLKDLAAQTRAISPRQLDRRLALTDPAEELLPWIEQFNALMVRLERAYSQLEGFNADVAHELRTPLAALIGQTEVALSRERSADSLRETLADNLEQLQRLSAMVNDMLFLSQADRGASARRGEAVSLAALATQVVEFHEASIEDVGLTVRIAGDVKAAVDEPLFKRAVSNLLGNAIRFAERGSQITIHIEPDAPDQVRVVCDNAGPEIEPAQVPRLFDRFFRGDASRVCPDGQQHHGLGLAIVAAIARMHAGSTLAESRGGRTRIGFTLAAQ